MTDALAETQLWSNSRLRAFQECPRKYELHYIHGIEGEAMEHFHRGREVHRLIHEYGQYCLDNRRDMSDTRAKKIAATTDHAEAQRQFMRFVGRKAWDFTGIVGTHGDQFEVWYEAELPDGRGLFRGIIDFCTLIEDTLKVVDWKSGGFHFPDQPEHPTQQLLGYLWLVMQKVGGAVDRIVLEVDYVGVDYAWIWSGLSPGDLLGVEDLLCSQVDAITAARAEYGEGEWRMEPGNGCKTCQYRTICPMAAREHEYANEPEALVRGTALHAAGRAAANDALRAWVSVNGPYTDEAGLTWDRHQGKDTTIVKDGMEVELAQALIIGKALAKHIRFLKLEDLPDAFARFVKTKPGGRKWEGKKLSKGADDNGG